jgi:RHS repeat-associated protein
MVRGGTTYRIVSDWRGDVRLVLDTTKTGAAAVVEQIDYDEWGNVTNLVDPACTLRGTELCFQPFGFAGGVWDVTTGIVSFGARDYDLQTRRWKQKDPMRFDGGQENIYEYAGDDPISGTDPTGLGGTIPYPCCTLDDPPGTICVICVNPPPCTPPEAQACSCVCYRAGTGPNPIAQKPNAASCKIECDQMGYPGDKCGGDVMWP